MFPKGILFDLDDTIIAFESVADTAWEDVAEMYYKECHLTDSKELVNAILEARNWFWSDKARNQKARLDLNQARKDVVHIALEKLGIHDSVITDKISDTYSNHRTTLIQFFPKAEETLNYLKENKVSLALMTNGEAVYQRNKVERFNLEQYFDVILIEGEIGFGKPDKRIYHLAIEGLNLDPSDLWAIGDNLEWDVWGPQQMGIFSIWNDYKKRGLPESSNVVPDRIINSISELMKN